MKKLKSFLASSLGALFTLAGLSACGSGPEWDEWEPSPDPAGASAFGVSDCTTGRICSRSTPVCCKSVNLPVDAWGNVKGPQTTTFACYRSEVTCRDRNTGVVACFQSIPPYDGAPICGAL